MKNSALKVKARLEILPTEVSGRRVPIRSGYRPNHNFGSSDNSDMFIGQVDFNDDELHFPGSVSEVTITFVNSPGLEKEIKIGREWRVQEAKILVAKAIVTGIENEL